MAEPLGFLTAASTAWFQMLCQMLGYRRVLIAKMTHQVLWHIQVKSKDELIGRLEQYLREVNEQPVRFRWTHFSPLAVTSDQQVI